MSGHPDDAGRRGQIIREAARLFRERGFDATSVRDIAAATGLQSGSWVYYFRTKQEILSAVMEQGLEQALERLEAIVREQHTPREHFRALLATHLDTLLAPGQDFIPVLLYDWRSLGAEARPRVIALQGRYEAVWADAIRRLQDAGEWTQPTRIDRLLMFGALNWIAHWYRPDGALDVAGLAREAERFFLRTLPAEARSRRAATVRRGPVKLRAPSPAVRSPAGRPGARRKPRR